MQENVVERAFELARSGGFQSISDLARALKNEHGVAVESHLSSPSLRKQLTAIMKAGRPAVRVGKAAPVSSWAPHEDAILRAIGDDITARNEAATTLGRTRGAVDARMRKLGLINRTASAEPETVEKGVER